MAELNNLGRIPTRPLSYIDKDKAVEKEVVVDYETSKIYVSDETKVLHDVFEENIDRSLDARKGVAGGIAELDSAGKIPANQLPSFVDDVLELPTMEDFPAIGESGKIYIAVDTNKSYRWGGTVYVAITSGVVIGETENSAYRGDRGAAAYAHSIATGNQHEMTKSDVGLGNVPNVDTNDQTPTFTEAEAVSNINSGEKISTIFGKIKKLFNHIMTKKADLGEDGKLLPTQLPSIQNNQVVAQADTPVNDDTILWIDTDEEAAGYDLDAVLAKKADLGIDGKIPKAQIDISASDIGAVSITGGGINGDIDMQSHNIKNIGALYGKPGIIEIEGEAPINTETIEIRSSNPETLALFKSQFIFTDLLVGSPNTVEIMKREIPVDLIRIPPHSPGAVGGALDLSLLLSETIKAEQIILGNKSTINIGKNAILGSNILTLWRADLGFDITVNDWDPDTLCPRVELIGHQLITDDNGETKYTMNAILTGLENPNYEHDAANKRYVDNTINEKIYDRIRVVADKEVSASDWAQDAALGEFQYYAKIYIPGVDSTCRADVIFNREDAVSGNFSTFTETGDDAEAGIGYVTIYSKVQPATAIIINNILLIKKDNMPI